MLTRATRDELEKLKDALYNVATCPEKSCYPLFSDGIKTRRDFDEHLERGLSHPHYTSLFYKNGESILGLLQFFAIEEDKYLQLCGFYLLEHGDNALVELCEYIEKNYKGYELYFGFSDKNTEAADFLRNNGFLLIENDNHNVIAFSEYNPLPYHKNVKKIDIGNFDDFRLLHNVDSTVYWNSDRIFADFNNWSIYIYYQNSLPVATIFETDGEIFGSDFKDGIYSEQIYKSLLTSVLNDLKTKGTESMTFFNDDDTQNAVLDIGFRCVGRYHLYYKTI